MKKYLFLALCAFAFFTSCTHRLSPFTPSVEVTKGKKTKVVPVQFGDYTGDTLRLTAKNIDLVLNGERDGFDFSNYRNLTFAGDSTWSGNNVKFKLRNIRRCQFSFRTPAEAVYRGDVERKSSALGYYFLHYPAVVIFSAKRKDGNMVVSAIDASDNQKILLLPVVGVEGSFEWVDEGVKYTVFFVRNW